MSASTILPQKDMHFFMLAVFLRGGSSGWSSWESIFKRLSFIRVVFYSMDFNEVGLFYL